MAEGSSHFSALGAAGNKLLDEVHYLAALMAAARTERGPISKEISLLRDSISAECRTLHRRIERAFVLPVNRTLLAQLAAALPELADRVDGVAHMITAHRLGAPHAETITVMSLIERAVEIEVDALGHLRKATLLEDQYHEVARLTREARRELRVGLAEIVSGAPDARHAMRAHDVLDHLRAVIDSVYEIAGILRAIAIQES